ncbi:hypothetical protein LSH36_56g04022 [Paralvinella palmiformis]|uniref:MYND-type domain-containing protein n=1 Tax=Paralvinella palmiformis TaxID=53620 RepID=A0AAD9K529_9ANNE|nr:hypothetical protein LSH36_56g04022 [Paralvinella palmiformis]
MADDGRGLRDESDSRPFCELCGALENLKLCSGCERSYYCNREHQLTNWKRHKPKCGGRRRSAAVRRKADDNGELAKADDMAGGGGRLSTEPADADGRRPGQSRTHDGPDMRQTAAEQSAADSSNLLRDISHGARDINSPVVERSGGIQPYLTGDGTEDLTSSTTTTYDQSLDYELDAVGLPASINGQLKSRPMRVTMAPDPSNSSQAADIGYHDAVSMKKTRSFVDCPEHGGQALVTAYKSSDSCEQKMTGMTLQSRGTIAKVSSEPTFGTVRHACHTRVSSVENLSVRDVGATAERPGASKEENVFKIPNSVDHKGKRKITDCKPSSDLQESTKIQQEETRLADYVVKCLNDYGMCVVDTFMGEEKGTRILNEVRELQQHDELFHEGQTAQGQQKGQEIRGDKIAWVEKDDPHINYIGMLIARLDALMLSCSRRLGHYHINGRTKVSCCNTNSMLCL